MITSNTHRANGLGGAVFIGVALCCLAGCGDRGLMAVGGTVTLDGKPVTTGLITFQPAAGTKSRSSGATIRDGRYEIPADKGVVPGKYLVAVQAFKPTGRMIPDPQVGERPELGPVVFAEEQPMVVTISPGKDNVCDIRLTSAK
jgi:hypothetical protein